MCKRSFTVICVFYFLCFGSVLYAGELHRCQLANGRVHYSDGACPKGSLEIWVRDLGTNHGTLSEDARARQEDARAWQRQNRSEVAALVRLQNARRRGSSRSTSANDTCEKARKRRDQIRDREFKTMTFDRAVELDDQVREKCR